jgi:protein-S-isoprenylcysteine O-methyltransferase Ste14
LANLRSKLGPFFRSFVAFLILGVTQLSPVLGFMGPMIAPLLIYLPFTSVGRQYFFENLLQLFLPDRYDFIGQMIFCFGFLVFSVSFVQWVKYYHEGLGLFNRGLYSKIRHPQFLGIITMTFGLTIKSLTYTVNWPLIGVPFVTPNYHVGVSVLVGLWFLQVLGYIAFAALEERSLSQKFSQFGDYKANVPFLLPIKNPKRVSEVLFTVLLVVGLCVLLYLLPYDLIRRFSVNFIP